MIFIKNIKTLDGESINIEAVSSTDKEIDAGGKLFLFPGIIDTDFSFGLKTEHWLYGINAAIQGGITTILDSSNPTQIDSQIESIHQLLSQSQIPLTYHPFFNTDRTDIEMVGSQKSNFEGMSLILNQGQSELDEAKWEKIFQLASWKDLPVVFKAINSNLKIPLLEKAIAYAEKASARLYVLNVSTLEELKLIKEAREKSLLIYAETTSNHLFSSKTNHFLWEALNRGAIEAIGSGYTTDGSNENCLIWRGNTYDCAHPIFLLPHLLTAYHDKKLSLENIVRLIRINLYDIFKLNRKDQHWVLVNLEREELVTRMIDNKKEEMVLKGWPEYTLLNGRLFEAGGTKGT